MPRQVPAHVNFRLSLRSRVDTWPKAAPELSSTTIAARSSGIPDRWDSRAHGGDRRTVPGCPRCAADPRWVRSEDFQRVLPTNPRFALVRPVLLTHRFWRTLTGGDPQAVAQTRVISERDGRVFAFRIAGVLPQGFVFPLEIDGGVPDLLTPIVRNSGLEARREFHLVFRVPPLIDMAGVRVASGSGDGGPGRSAGTRRLGHIASRGPSPRHRSTGLRSRHWVIGSVRSNNRLRAFCSGQRSACSRSHASTPPVSPRRGTFSARAKLLLCRALGASIWDLGTLLLVEGSVLAGLSAAAAFALARPVLFQTLLVLPESMVFGEWPAITGRAAMATVLLALLSVLAVSSWPLALASRFGAAGAGRRF